MSTYLRNYSACRGKPGTNKQSLEAAAFGLRSWILCLGNSKNRYGEWMGSSPEEKDFGLFVDEKLNTIQQ